MLTPGLAALTSLALAFALFATIGPAPASAQSSHLLCYCLAQYDTSFEVACFDPSVSGIRNASGNPPTNASLSTYLLQRGVGIGQGPCKLGKLSGGREYSAPSVLTYASYATTGITMGNFDVAKNSSVTGNSTFTYPNGYPYVFEGHMRLDEKAICWMALDHPTSATNLYMDYTCQSLDPTNTSSFTAANLGPIAIYEGQGSDYRFETHLTWLIPKF
jgi:hypothetical protein